MPNILDIMRDGPVIPVIVIDRLEWAVPLARALVEGGVRVLEVTLRTPVALAAVRAIAEAVPDALVGVGTVTRPDDLRAASEAGARFAVSPGLTPALAEAAAAGSLPLLPGIMTPSDAMRAREAGFTALKLFPAQQAGGAAMLRALHGPFPDLVFCPTGGVTPANAPELLGLPNVACVGGSWLTPRTALASGDWASISALARAASRLGHA